MEDSFRCLTDFLPMTNQKKPMGPDNEFVELLWRNGNVTMHSQNHQRNHGNVSELKQTQKLDQVQKYEQSLGNSSNLMQESETESWLQYPLDDSFEEQFCSEFFPEIASTDKVVSDKISKNFNAEEDMRLKFDSTNGSNAFTAFASNQSLQENKMPPPRFHFMFSTQSSCSENCGVQNLLHLSKSKKADLGSLSCQLGHKGSASNSKADAEESSMMTVGSSICRSNQIQSQTNPDDPLSNDAADIIAGVKEDTGLRLPSEKRQSKAHEGTVTSSSGGSGCSYGRTGHQNASNQNHKRKERDIVDSGCQSEEAEYETIREKQSSQQPTSKCRSRAAEVHNLSERRRRDRINEKMKALQELIPHCNKTDKASMLDEAIEYMKSLQLQVQMMWMGTTTASSMMFPGVQQYMSGMGVGMSHASMPTIHSAVQFPRVPFVNQSVTSAYSANQTSTFPSPVINAVNFPNQMQNNHLPESYAGCLGFHIMQPHQATDFCTFGYHKMQQNHSSVEPSSSLLCGTGEPTCVNIGHDKSG